MVLADLGELASTDIRRRLRDTGLLESELDAHDEDAARGDAAELEIAEEGAEREDERIESVLDGSPVIEMLLAEIARRGALAPCVYPWSRQGAVIQRTGQHLRQVRPMSSCFGSRWRQPHSASSDAGLKPSGHSTTSSFWLFVDTSGRGHVGLRLPGPALADRDRMYGPSRSPAR